MFPLQPDVCKNNPNCHYKLYKRKEQECEELKTENNTYKSSIVANLDKSISKRYRELLEENDKLKKENDTLFKAIEEVNKINKRLEAENDKLKKRVDELEECEDIFFQENEDFRKIYSCLQEIKEIAESEIDSKEFMAIQCMLNGSVDNKNKVLKQILQKISEVQNAV